jgi:tRNA(Leu) C34 or U34 (ribose-2'-O)-methylase TrmL
MLGNNAELTLVNPFGFVLGTGFNTNGINAMTLLAAPQAFAQISGGNSYVDLMSTANPTSLVLVTRLAGASYSTQADLDQSSIIFGSDHLAIKQLNLMAATVDFTPASVLKSDIVRVVAPWFQGGSILVQVPRAWRA